ncbi:MAG: glucosaminidase domain-containing protein [Tidjanibacter sp.]|nr:glucosaminidase domain-containing protein [Tidjanibacter sp.]
MRKFATHILLLVVAVVAVAQSPVAAQQTLTRAQYIEQYAPMAVESQLLYGIPASITLAQGCLESGNGNSRLAREANNHFGIKCGGTWDGPSLRHDDDAPQECFRSYNSVAESYVDHALFLSERERYRSLFDLDPKDYKGWARGLKAAGYATNPAYAELLIRIIEENNLQRFDNALLADYVPTVVEQPAVEVEEPAAEGDLAVAESAPVVEEKVVVDVDEVFVHLESVAGYGIRADVAGRYVVAKGGENLRQIGRKVGVSPRALARINSLGATAQLEKGHIIRLE